MGQFMPNISSVADGRKWAQYFRDLADEIDRQADRMACRNYPTMRDKLATYAAIEYVDYFLKKDHATTICPFKASIHGHDARQIAAITEVRRAKWVKIHREKRNNAIRKLARKPKWTQERIARRFGLSRGRVQQITQER